MKLRGAALTVVWIIYPLHRGKGIAALALLVLRSVAGYCCVVPKAMAFAGAASEGYLAPLPNYQQASVVYTSNR